MGLPGGTSGKEPCASTRDLRDTDFIPRSGRSPGEGNGNPLRYSCLEKSHGQRSHGVPKSQTRLSHRARTQPFMFRSFFMLPNDPPTSLGPADP